MAERFLEFSWNIEGDQLFSRKIAYIGKALKDFKPALEKIDVYMRKEINANFSSAGKTLSDGWVPLKDKKANHPILIKTGKMRDSFYSDMTNTALTIGNNVFYFKYHQSNQPRYKLPRRVMLNIKNKQRVEIARAFTWYLNEVAKHYV